VQKEINDQIEMIDSRGWISKLGIGFFAVLAIVFCWFGVRWQIGNMLAELNSPNESTAKQIAETAVGFAPSDPITNWFQATTEKDSKKSLKYYEQTVKLAPNDYRWWLELGRVRDQVGDKSGSELAFINAIKLAPKYSFTHWSLGNFYLRENKETEALAELKIAAESDVLYRDQVFSTLWEYFDKDLTKLEPIAADSAMVKAGLAKFYARHELTKDSLRVWNSLTTEQKAENRPVAEIILQAFYEKKFFRVAVEFARDIGTDSEAKIETVDNFSFEQPIKNAGETMFGWRVSPLEKFDVKLDSSHKKEGNRSLRVSFMGFTGVEIKNLRQFIAVQPSQKYRLTFWLRTENLKSGGTPNLEVANAIDDKIIATSKLFPTGTNEWQQLRVDFVAPTNSEAIEIRTNRGFCGENCPIFGSIWYDDFSLARQ
jgi:hypothetical protein